MNVQHTTYQNINKQKWDECIRNSSNQLVYAESWYLDITCPNKWDALILNDYEAVMPLPLKSKMGLTYVQQPIWTQQLGVFSTLEITSELTDAFLQAIPKKMALVSINLNETNFTNTQTLQPKTNLILQLNTPFETLKNNFSSNTKRNINKASKEDLSVDFESTNVEEFMTFFQENIQTPISEFHHTTLSKIISHSVKNNLGFIAVIKEEDTILAASFILKSTNRLIYRTGTSNPKGKELKAMFLLVESIIQKFANSNYQLDFEGSEIEGVARFYKGFGASITPYYYYKKYNNKLLQVLKKGK